MVRQLVRVILITKLLFITPTTLLSVQFFIPLKDEIAAKILNLVPKNIELEKKGTLEDCPLTPDTFLNTTATVGEMGSVGLGGLSIFYLFRILYGTIRAKKQIGLLDEIFNTVNSTAA